MTAHLHLTRAQILAFRQLAGALVERLPAGADRLRRAAWGGLQDSVPRAASLSLHARVEDATPASWEDPSLIQVWGPRHSAYVVAAADRAVFTRGRLPPGGAKRRRAEELAARLAAHLDGEAIPYGAAGRALGIDPNQLRYAALTGTVLLRWDGARPPVVWTVPSPEVDDHEARRELARRYLHLLGPATPEAFATWAGIGTPLAAAVFDELGDETIRVGTPLGEAWLLASDERLVRGTRDAVAPARLLPSGDPYYLLWGAARELLVPDADRRGALWTPRVWPGALLVEGEIVGTWRRTQHTVRLHPWRRPTRTSRAALEAEATTLPLPGLDRPIVVAWADPSP